MTHVKEGKNDQIPAHIHTDDVQIRAESKVKDKLAFSSLKKKICVLRIRGKNEMKVFLFVCFLK